MSKIPFIAKALAIIAVTAVVGGLIAYILFDVIEYRLPSGEWQPASLGQEKAVRILGWDLESGAGYVQTNQGHVYSCRGIQGDRFGSFTFRCEPAPVPQVSSVRFNQRLYTPPSPPGEVSDSFVGPGPYDAYCSGQTNFVILSDGSVWTWNKTGCCEVGCLFDFLVPPVIGVALGLVFGIVIVVVQRKRTRPRDMAKGSSPTHVPIRPAQFLGRLSLFAGLIVALMMIVFGAGVNFRIYVPLAVAGLIVFGIVLLLIDRRSGTK